mmetsp:Transcript_64695/g.162810  ORF Transcript_64695/g.162810 Transcript_64695/m.162810 type:complete len:118 (+) Transcript_64695:104-457(+)
MGHFVPSTHAITATQAVVDGKLISYPLRSVEQEETCAGNCVHLNGEGLDAYVQDDLDHGAVPVLGLEHTVTLPVAAPWRWVLALSLAVLGLCQLSVMTDSGLTSATMEPSLGTLARM